MKKTVLATAVTLAVMCLAFGLFFTPNEPTREPDDAQPWWVSPGDEFWPTAAAVVPGQAAPPEAGTFGGPATADQQRLTTSSYELRVDADGMHFTPYGPGGDRVAVADPNSELRLRLARLAVGTTLIEPQPGEPLPRRRDGNTIQSLIGAPDAHVVEHVSAATSGAAVTWLMKRRPEQAGALTLDIEVQGLTHAGTTASGEHYADASGISRVVISHAQLVDRDGQIVPVEPERARGACSTTSQRLRWRAWPGRWPSTRW